MNATTGEYSMMRRTRQCSRARVATAGAAVLVVALAAGCPSGSSKSGGSSSSSVHRTTARATSTEPRHIVALQGDGAVVVISVAIGAVERTVVPAGQRSADYVLGSPALSSDGRTLYYVESYANCGDLSSVIAVDLTRPNATPAPIAKGHFQLVSPDGQWTALVPDRCPPPAPQIQTALTLHNLRTGEDRPLAAFDGRAHPRPIAWSRDSKLLEVQADSGYSTYEVASGHRVAGPVSFKSISKDSGEKTVDLRPIPGGGVVSMAKSGNRSSKLETADVLSSTAGSSITGKPIKSLGTYPLLAQGAAVDHSGSHLLLTGVTGHTWSEMKAPGHDFKPFDSEPSDLYAASNGKLRKIANGTFTWAQWLLDDVVLAEPASPAPSSDVPPGQTALPVTACSASFGAATPPPIVPQTVNVPTSAEDARDLAGYSDGIRTTVLAPKTWQCGQSISESGSTFTAAPNYANYIYSGNKDEDPAVTVETAPNAMSATFLLCAYFDIAKAKYDALRPRSTCGLYLGEGITSRTHTVVRFDGTARNGNRVMGAARLTPIHDAARPEEWGTGEVVKCALPPADAHLCSTIVDTYLSIAQPKVG